MFFLLVNLMAQQKNLSVEYIKKESLVSPGQIINLPFLVKNISSENKNLDFTISPPNNWKLITKSQAFHLDSGEEKVVLFTVQSGSATPVDNYELNLYAIDKLVNDTLSITSVSLQVEEIVKISLLFVKSPDNINAGEIFTATYLLQNLGNTSKKVFIETQNCDIVGSSEIEVDAGKSVQFNVATQTLEDLQDARKEFYTVRAVLGGEVQQSTYRSFTVYPTKQGKKDLFFRFPISATASYVATNVQDKFESAFQFQIFGEGALDMEGKHKFQFLARGPDLTNLSYLGLYDQYFVGYSNKNVELFVGDKAYSFTPLTESSRFGFGTENKVIFNNGLNFGFIYVKPTYYEDIQNEIAGFTGFEFNKRNKINVYYVQKNDRLIDVPVQLASVTADLSPWEKTAMELEFSRGYFDNISDNAFRTSLNTQFWIFYLAGVYFYTGKNYPGYYSNSTFYSGNISARISKKINFGVFAKEDFSNAELDTFFVTAPYTKSFQSSLNYNIAPRAYLRFFWRQFERKDRLVQDKFHYKTKSLNTQLSHKVRKVEYSLLGEFGETTNLLLTENNKQNTFRGIADVGYRFNQKNSVRVTGSWSNINSFVTGDNRNVTSGLFIVSQITKNLKADIHVQNAYDIDDYYRNRNLMQLNVEYKFLRHHVISARSFYTLYKQHVDNPEFTATLNYTYNFGIPLKQIVKAGNVKGRITYDNDESAEGVIVNLQNKSTITNKNGEFLFNTVQPGRHLLFVDRSKFEINQIVNIPSPLEIEVFEDEETVVNFKITTGAKVIGKISFANNEMGVFTSSDANAESIIVELGNDFDQFRITTDREGNFSFPLVRPGNYKFKIYESSLPEGYEIENSEYQLKLASGEEKSLQLELKLKKRNIIFKPSTNLLTPLKKENLGQDKTILTKTDKTKVYPDSVFYSIQVGAFRKRQTNNSRFFSKQHFDFEQQINNVYKYFIGKFETLDDAKKAKKDLESDFKNSFIVIFKNNEIQD